MASFTDLIQRLPQIHDVSMSTAGVATWICWEGDLDPSVEKTLQDYGGILIKTDRNQAIWFFFNIDAVLAFARLFIWSKFNPLSIGVEIMPARLVVSVRHEFSIAVDMNLIAQELLPQRQMQIWVHPKVREMANNLPGITYVKEPLLQGMATLAWEQLDADLRLPYNATHSWYGIIHPLGNPLDKNYQKGWRYMHKEFDQALQSKKFKYNLHNDFMMTPIDDLRSFRAFTQEVLATINDVKNKFTDQYWPCVCAVVDRRGLNLNNELPQRIGIKWDSLVPDFPYMNYRNAYLLGDGFTLNELHFSSSSATMDSWCTVGLGENQMHAGSYIPVLLSAQLVDGDNNNCFYCGSKKHTPNACPTKKVQRHDINAWKKIGTIDVENINKAFEVIDVAITAENIDGYYKILASENDASAVLGACLDICSAAQLRKTGIMWIGSSDLSSAHEEASQVEVRDENPVWNILERLKKASPQELVTLEREIQSSMDRGLRDSRLRTLAGFVSMEKGDNIRALAMWKEAAALSNTTQVQVWHMFLQGRLLECSGKYLEAQECYQNALRIYPNWVELEYRLIVCRVKMGFAEQVQSKALQLIEQHPDLLNRMLIDPELERGHLAILLFLYDTLNTSLQQAEAEQKEIERLTSLVHSWFDENSGAAQNFRTRLEHLSHLSVIKNYIAAQNVITSRTIIEADVEKQVKREIDIQQAAYKHYLSILEVIRDEASWFPFPKALIEFNKDFNDCAGIINWAFSANFNDAESFKRAKAYAGTVTDLLSRLENRLKFLRIVRDSTLFILILARTFFWIELAGLSICLFGIPGILFFGDIVGLGWLQSLISANHWEIQKVMVVIISVIALGVSGFRTTLIFEKRRDKLLVDAKEQREIMQQQRLERIRAARQQNQEDENLKDRSQNLAARAAKK